MAYLGNLFLVQVVTLFGFWCAIKVIQRVQENGANIGNHGTIRNTLRHSIYSSLRSVNDAYRDGKNR